jgi:uncharacterized membrane protein YedE/YeeE
VLAFLDLFGAWDPSLIFTMGGGLLVTGTAYFATLGRNASLLGEPIQVPSNTTLDFRLIGGSLLFGVGWGLSGVCPGPAIVNLGFFNGRAVEFVAAMLVGMALYELFNRLATTRATVTVDA